MIIREERQDDAERIRRVNLAAFETSTEADLVDTLRRRATPLVSLVAEDDANVIGHILFSPVTVASEPGLILMGLAPMAVMPSRQRQGVGSTLVREGLERYTVIVNSTAPALLWTFLAYVMWLPVLVGSERVPHIFGNRVPSPAEVAAKANDVASITSPPRFPGMGF